MCPSMVYVYHLARKVAPQLFYSGYPREAEWADDKGSAVREGSQHVP